MGQHLPAELQKMCIDAELSRCNAISQRSPTKFKDAYLSAFEARLALIQKGVSSYEFTQQSFKSMKVRNNTITPIEWAKEIDIEFLELLNATRILRDGKIIAFPSEQASVFRDVSTTYTESLDYRLPFKSTILQFSSSPVEIAVDKFHDEITAILLAQIEITEDVIRQVQTEEKGLSIFPWTQNPSCIGKENIGNLANVAIAIFSDTNIRKLTWISGQESTFEIQAVDDSPWQNAWMAIKNLAIACIGYINCENIYLHKEGEVPEAVNRKRERKGKSRLEPYYICRIRGVNYDSHTTGTGTAHGHRYDVRGHFRRLSTGKVTWVRPHQRGLANELYIPKVYKVDKRSSD